MDYGYRKIEINPALGRETLLFVVMWKTVFLCWFLLGTYYSPQLFGMYGPIGTGTQYQQNLKLPSSFAGRTGEADFLFIL